jgi:uncharacterized protein YbcI
MNHLTLTEQSLDSVQADNLLLEQERTNVYNKIREELQVIVKGWKEKLSECQLQVIYLKRILTKKVASLKVALDLQMKSEGLIAILEEDKSCLTVPAGQRLNKVLIERVLVALL